MKIQMQDASAQVYDVEAPDDATVSDIEKEASKAAGRELKLVNPPSKLSYGINMLKKGIAGIPAIAGLPFDAAAATGNLIALGMNATVGKLGFPQQQTRNYTGHAHDIEKAVVKLQGGKETLAPSTASKYLIGKPAQFIGGGLPFGAAMVAKSAKPLVSGLTELTSGYAGGVGLAAGEDIGEGVGRSMAKRGGFDMDEAGQIGKALGGAGASVVTGGGTAMLAPQVIGRAVTGVRDKLLPAVRNTEEQKALVGSLHTKRFREALLSDPRWQDNVKETLKTQADINRFLESGVLPSGKKFEPTLAMATGTPAMRMFTQQAETESATAAARGVEKRVAIDDALNAYREGNFPRGERSVQELSADEIAGMERGLQQRQQVLDADLERLTAKVKSGNFGEAEARELQAIRDEQYSLARGITDAEYSRVYQEADKLGFQGSMDPLMGYISRYESNPNLVAQKEPGFMGAIKEAIRDGAMQTRADAVKAANGLDKLPESMTEFVVRHGGLNRELVAGDGLVDISRAPNWATRNRQGKGSNFWLQHGGDTAKSPDMMRELLVDRGYLPAESSIDDMYRALEQEHRAGGPMMFSMRDVDEATRVLMGRKEAMDFEFGGQAAPFDLNAKYPAKFGVLHSVLKRIREEKRYYADRNTSEARRAMDSLNELEKITMGQIDAAGDSVAQLLRGADEKYSTTVAQPFYEGAAASTFRDVKQVENVGRLMLNRGEEGARNFQEVFGSSERANDLLWNAVLDQMGRNIGAKDVTAARVRSFYEAHRKFLDQFPQIRTRVLTVGDVAEGLESRAVDLAASKRAVNQDILQTLVGNNDIESTLMNIVPNEAKMRQVAHWAQRSEGMAQEIARTYVDALEKTGDPATFLASNAKTLKPIFDAVGPKQWENIQTLMKGREIAGRGAPSPIVKPEIVDDVMQALTGTSTSGIFSRIRGAVYNFISPAYVLVDVGGKYFFRVQREHYRELVNEALYDPKLIRNLLDLEHELELPKPDSAKIKAMMEEMKGHYANHGLRVAMGAFNTLRQDPEEERQRIEQERDMQRAWRRKRTEERMP